MGEGSKGSKTKSYAPLVAEKLRNPKVEEQSTVRKC